MYRPKDDDGYSTLLQRISYQDHVLRLAGFVQDSLGCALFRGFNEIVGANLQESGEMRAYSGSGGYIFASREFCESAVAMNVPKTLSSSR